MLTDFYYVRTSKKLSLRQLAENSGVPKTTIHKIENGKLWPRVDTMCLLANALNITPEQLLTILIKNENF